MRYVFFAFLLAAAAALWTQNTEKGRSVMRHLSDHPVDPRWSH